MMKPRPIKIKAVLNGYIVTVGCEKVVFKSRKKMFKEIARYFDDPESIEKKYRGEEDDITVELCYGAGRKSWTFMPGEGLAPHDESVENATFPCNIVRIGDEISVDAGATWHPIPELPSDGPESPPATRRPYVPG